MVSTQHPTMVVNTPPHPQWSAIRSEEHTSELQSRLHLVCRLLLEKKKHRIPAWLFVPPKKRSRRAALVSPHGGPEAQTVNEWIIKYQFLVSQGFTVLAPHYMRATG